MTLIIFCRNFFKEICNTKVEQNKGEMETKGAIYKQHEENQEWTNKLNFYKDEVKIMTGRLEEIASKNSASDVLKQIEHFQNQFIVQRNNIDEALHSVKIQEEELQTEVRNNPVAVDRRVVSYHEKEKDFVQSLEKNLTDLRSEFNQFSSKWM